MLYCNLIKKYKYKDVFLFTINMTSSSSSSSSTSISLNQNLNEKTSTPRICLNMIVKNEKKVIRRLLESVLPIIDTYCICDTGSTDDTIEIIESFFKEYNIVGKIIKETFIDFGYNRTYALKECDKMENIDYILLMDADMVLEISSVSSASIACPGHSNPRLPGEDCPSLSTKESLKQIWKHPAHYVFQGTEKFYYKNVRFVKHGYGMSYWGVTHEYVKVPEGTTYGLFDKTELFINDVGDGGSKSDKFERDIRLLTKGLEQEPNNDRYTFYLANSLRDSGRTDEAIEMFKKRVKIGGWIEEIWHSLYSIGKCYQKMDNMEMAVFYWLEAYNVFPCRIENIYKIINYYREKGKNELAYSFYVMADRQRNANPTQDYLFMEKEVYDHKLDYELSIIGYYCNSENYDLPKCCIKVMCYPHIEEWMSRNILSNYKFYAPKISTLGIPSGNVILSSKIDNIFNSSTPSITLHDNCVITNIRHVNYHIDDKGGYIQKENIETRNVLHVTTTHTYKEFPLQYNKFLDNSYVGLEDVRLFSYQNRLLYNANRGLGYSTFVIEHGEIDINTGESISSVLLHVNKDDDGGLCKNITQHQIEKNWVLIEGKRNELKCIYQWHPLVIGDIETKNGLYTITHEIPTPRCFKHFRGSTNGVLINNEIWCICHIVSYEDRRYYYHVFVVLDPITYEVCRFSRFFTFEGEKVEYTLGFIYIEATNTIQIGYSTMDKTTKFMEISLSKIQELFTDSYPL
jgi:glycosyltransferase involved in cell wall biosynthesis